MHKTDQRNSNNFHGYKKIDLIVKSKFIESQQTHRKRFTSYGSPRDHCIENPARERENHLATNYEPEGLQGTTHASLERHHWKW